MPGSPAGELHEGDQLRTPDGDTVEAQSIQSTGRRQTVYNIEVDGHHNYHVATEHQTWILVHNNDDCVPVPRKPGRDFDFDTREEALHAAAVAHGAPADIPLDEMAVHAKPQYGNNPNLIGPKGEPWEQVDVMWQNPDGSLGQARDIAHHASGHRFNDRTPPEVAPPHYHGPEGYGHYYYPAGG